MDDERLRAFLRDDYARVLAAVELAVRNPDRAEDAVQDAVVALWEASEPVLSPRAWVATVALNRARSHFRRVGAERRALERLSGRQQSEVAQTSGGEPVGGVDDEVLVAVQNLPSGQRQAVALHYLLDLSVSEVAAVLGTSEGTVKTHLFRARATLRTRIRRSEGMDDAGR